MTENYSPIGVIQVYQSLRIIQITLILYTNYPDFVVPLLEIDERGDKCTLWTGWRLNGKLLLGIVLLRAWNPSGRSDAF